MYLLVVIYNECYSKFIFCTCHGVSYIRKTFQRISIVFYNVRLFTAFVFSISIIKIRETKKSPFIMFNVKHYKS